MALPNFLIIGAAEAGTTPLYESLRQHPALFLPALREPYFFAYEGDRLDQVFCGPGDDVQYKDTITRWEDYRQLFDTAQAQAAAALGERSAVYLYSPKAPARIHHYVPRAKLIAILRQPADRAFSHYVLLRREGREPLPDFAQALQQEEARIRQNWGPAWHYQRRGFYAEQLERYLALFPRPQLRVYFREDWQADHRAVLRDIFRFLDVDETFEPRLAHHAAVGMVPRSRAWHNLLTRPHPVKDRLRPLLPKPLADRLWLALQQRNLTQPRLDPHLRAALTETYRADIRRLQNLLQRDLTPWLTPGD